MNKRLLTVLGGLIVLIAVIIGFILYLSSKNNQTAQNNSSSLSPGTTSDQNSNSLATNAGSNSANNGSASATQTSTSKIHRISDVVGVGPALSFDGSAVWFFTPDGHLFKVNVSTGLKQEYLLPQQLSLTDAIWPITGDNFIIITGSGTAKSFHYYDSSTSSFITYPQSIKEMDFMPDGSQIAYDFVSGLQSWLSIADKQAKNFQDIVKLPAADLTVKISPSGTKAFAYDNSNPQDGKLNLIDINAKSLVTIGTSLENSAVWSPDGVKFVYNRSSGKTKNDDLWLGDSQAVSNQDTHIQSSISKVVFDHTGSNVYIAVPTVDGLSEQIWKINTQTLDKTPVYTPSDTDPKIKATHLLLSADSRTLYFQNADGYVYSIDLAQ